MRLREKYCMLNNSADFEPVIIITSLLDSLEFGPFSNITSYNQLPLGRLMTSSCALSCTSRASKLKTFIGVKFKGAT